MWKGSVMGPGFVRGLKVAVGIMSVLIVAGVVTLAVLISKRMSGPPSQVTRAVLDEPAGTRLAGASLAGDRMAVQLAGGGPDRIVIVDIRNGRVLGRIGLTR